MLPSLIKLEKSGIQTRTVFTGNILRQPVAKKFKWTSCGKLHNADKIMRSGLLIGCHELISKKNIDFIIHDECHSIENNTSQLFL
mgnify:CR=1 FL=1